eukprot:6028321-Prymnesium_polylepis.1
MDWTGQRGQARRSTVSRWIVERGSISRATTYGKCIGCVLNLPRRLPSRFSGPLPCLCHHFFAPPPFLPFGSGQCQAFDDTASLRTRSTPGHKTRFSWRLRMGPPPKATPSYLPGHRAR